MFAATIQPASRSAAAKVEGAANRPSGHAVMHPDRRRPGFTLKEAVVYLRGVEQ